MKENKQVPNHIAFILDGNGRWARRRGLPRKLGHLAGIEAVKRTIINCANMAIKVVSMFAFSTENWKRDKEEVDAIFDYIMDFVSGDLTEFEKYNFQVRTMGDISKLPKKLYDKLLEVEKKTKDNHGMVINIGLNYGGRAEIVMAVNKLISQGKKEITEKELLDNLYTQGLPEPDLLIRTSGEKRISNFMLYQLAYSELYFPKVYWPDFNLKHLKKAIKEYQNRDRRFGKIKEK